MALSDYIVLAGYFLILLLLGVSAGRQCQTQEDFLMAGRRTGSVMQALLFFGVHGGSWAPVMAAGLVFAAGYAGIWVAAAWMCLAPVFWIAAVWYRRMRFLSLGGFFSQRYESHRMAGWYAVAGLLFYTALMAAVFSSVGRVGVSLFGEEVRIQSMTMPTFYVVLFVLVVSVMIHILPGGLLAAIWASGIQLFLVLLLTFFLFLPEGLRHLAEVHRAGGGDSWLHGLRILHRELPVEYLGAFHWPGGAVDFIAYVLAVVLMVGAVALVLPHQVFAGGGSAWTEMEARVGSVMGILVRGLCVWAWGLTTLVGLALAGYSGRLPAGPDAWWSFTSEHVLRSTDRIWLLLALLGITLSAVGGHLVAAAGLFVRGLYVGWINPNARDRSALRWARWSGGLVLGVAASIAAQFHPPVWPILRWGGLLLMGFSVPFWLGIFWRRASGVAAWTAILYGIIFWVLLPWLTPLCLPQLRTHPPLLATVPAVSVTPPALDEQGKLTPPRPVESFLFWTGDTGLESGRAPMAAAGVSSGEALRARGGLRIELLLIHAILCDLTGFRGGSLLFLEACLRLLVPLVLMLAVSAVFPAEQNERMHHFYVRMKTPVDPAPPMDRAEVEFSEARPARFDHLKIFPRSAWEFSRFRATDGVGIAVILVVLAVIAGGIWFASRFQSPDFQWSFF